MTFTRKETNSEKLAYLKAVLTENIKENNKDCRLFFSIIVERYGNKLPVIHKQPASEDVTGLVTKYATTGAYKPEYLYVDIYTGKSRNAKKIASFKFDYRGSS